MTEMVLLPAPQALRTLAGTFSVTGAAPLTLRGVTGQELLPAARLLIEAFERAGIAVNPTALFPAAAPHVVLEVDPAAVTRPEGYRLAILPDQVRLSAHDVA